MTSMEIGAATYPIFYREIFAIDMLAKLTLGALIQTDSPNLLDTHKQEARRLVDT